MKDNRLFTVLDANGHDALGGKVGRENAALRTFLVATGRDIDALEPGQTTTAIDRLKAVYHITRDQ